MTYHLAIDLGASSGRHILGWLEDGQIRSEEVYRFKNEPSVCDGHLCWDADELFRQILTGMRRCGELGTPPATVGVDTWGVDFVLLDGEGNRLGNAVSYRDSRTDGMVAQVARRLPEQELYRRTGVQAAPYNTIYQLAALKEQQPEQLSRARQILLISDYFHYLLSGVPVNEYSQATTTGLVDVHHRAWDTELTGLLGLPEHLFAHPLAMPGTDLGPLTDEIAQAVGYRCSVVLPVSHDTGSAFLAVPARETASVCISSGTWSLLGVENEKPVTSVESRRAGFTNEGSYQCRYGYLKNIMGLWMLQRVRAECAGDISFATLSHWAEDSECNSLVDVDDQRFFAPVSMQETVRQVCLQSAQVVPVSVGDVARCIYRSLARSYATSIRSLEQMTGVHYTAVHIVGGGSQDEYLNRLTAIETGIPVYAGPTESSALGNLMVQMIASGELSGLTAARAALCRSFSIQAFHP